VVERKDPNGSLPYTWLYRVPTRLWIASKDQFPMANLQSSKSEFLLMTRFNRSLIFSKKHFWFGAEPVEHKSLSSYLRGEKPEVGNHNAAWASHTGKGLLFFGKKDSDKTSPAGVINLVSSS